MELTETREGPWYYTENTLNSASSSMLCLFALLKKRRKQTGFSLSYLLFKNIYIFGL